MRRRSEDIPRSCGQSLATSLGSKGYGACVSSQETGDWLLMVRVLIKGTRKVA